MQPHTYVISKATWSQARKPIVYAWIRGEQWLYVGFSTQGLARIYGPHEKIGVRESVLDEDEIRVWEFEAPGDAWSLEHLLIQQFRPKYNRAGNPDVPTPRWAGKQYPRKRPETAPGRTLTGLPWVAPPKAG